MKSNLLIKTLSTVLVLLFTGSVGHAADPAPKKAAPAKKAAPVKTALPYVSSNGDQKPDTTTPNSKNESAAGTNSLTKDPDFREDEYQTKYRGCKDEYLKLTQKEWQDRYGSSASIKDCADTNKKDKADECEKQSKEIDELKTKCGVECQSNVYTCFKPGDPQPQNLTATFFQTMAQVRGVPVSLNTPNQPQKKDSKTPVLSCKDNPDHCNETKEKKEKEVADLQEKMVKAKRESTTADAQHKKDLAAIEKKGVDAQHEADKAKIKTNNEMSQKELAIQRQTADLKKEATVLSAKLREISNNLQRTPNIFKQKMQLLDGSKEKLQCTKEANTAVPKIKSSVSGGVGNAVGGGNVKAWQDAYVSCQLQFQSNRQALQAEQDIAMNSLNEDYKQVQNDQAENSRALVLQTDALQKNYQAMQAQLSVDEQKYYEFQIANQREWNEENQNDLARKQDDAAQMATLNNQMELLKQRLNTIGVCPEKSNPKTSLNEDLANYESLQNSLAKYQGRDPLSVIKSAGKDGADEDTDSTASAKSKSKNSYVGTSCCPKGAQGATANCLYRMTARGTKTDTDSVGTAPAAK